jgi:hypothetical protein
MMYIIHAAVFLAALAAGLFITFRAMDELRWLSVWSIGSLLYWSVMAGLLFGYAVDLENKHPCAQYETRLIYNAAVKSMMPARVCVLRAEWEESK